MGASKVAVFTTGRMNLCSPHSSTEWTLSDRYLCHKLLRFASVLRFIQPLSFFLSFFFLLFGYAAWHVGS